jgi:hypothetical protein
VIGQREARAQPCPPASPACHLENGKQLLRSDPRKAADELLASYQLDERTDTLVLYATALALDHRYALALETWKRVIVFRDSEVETAKETARTTTGRRRAAARATQARAEKQSAEAADAIIQLWTKVGNVRVRLAAGQRFAVTRDGAEVDLSQDVTVNAGRDELVFTGKDGSVERVAVEVPAGGLVKIDAPSAQVARTGPAPRKESAASSRSEAVRPKEPAATAAPSKVEAARSPKESAMAAASPRTEAARSPKEPPVTEPSKPSPKIAVAPPKEPVAESPKPSPKVAVPPRVTEPADAPRAPIKDAPTLTADRYIDAPRSLTMSRVGLGLTAGAIAVGSVAAGFAYLASRDYDDARTAGCSASGQCPFGQAADLARRSNDRARIAQVGAIGAGVLAATGVTLWFVGRRTIRQPVSDLALHVGPSSTAISGGVSAAVTGRF